MGLFTVVGDWIRCGPQAIKGVASILICFELSSQVTVNLVLVLLFIQSICRSLPDINRCIYDWLLCLHINHTTMHVGHFSIVDPVHNRCLILKRRRIVPEEWTQDCAGRGGIGSFCCFLECDFVHESTLVSWDDAPLRSWIAYDSKPSTSQTSCPSFLLSSLILPAQFMSWTPSIHSSTVSSFSLAKS